MRLNRLSATVFALLATPLAAEVRDIDAGLDWSRCEGPLLEASSDDAHSAGADDAKAVAPIRLEADDASLFPDERLVKLGGRVVARQGDLQVEANDIEFAEDEGQLTARGGVLLTSAEIRLVGEQAEVDLRRNTAVMDNAEYRLPLQHARGSAGRVRMHDRARSIFEKISYTTCAPGDAGWLLEAGQLEVDRDSGIGEARDASLAFQGVPFLYTPYVQFPIDDRRMSGLLAPTFGYSGDKGLDVAIPYYLNLAPNMDATLQPRVMSDRGLMLGGEFRYLSPSTYSELGLEWMPRDEGRAAGQDRSRLAAGFDGEGRLPWGGRYDIDYRYTSDAEYFEDFGDSLAVSSQTHLPRRGSMVYRGRDWRLLGRLEYYQTLDEQIAPANRPYARLPQLLYTAKRRGLIGGLDGELRTEYVYFDRNTGITGHRLDLQPAISYPLERAWGFVTPRVSLRSTAYWLEENQSVLHEDQPTRSLPTFSLDSGLFFERHGDWFGRAVTQTLEPRLFYLYTPYRDQQDLPDFDSAPLDFSFAGLFRDNRFSGGDRVGDANQLTMALSSRLLDGASGEERLRLAFGGIAYFDDREVQLTGNRVDDDSGSALVSEVAARIGAGWSVTGGIQWDPHGERENTERSAVRLSYRSDSETERQQILNLSYRYDEDLLEQGDLSFRAPLGERFDLVGRWNYSLRDNETMEVFGGVEYDSCCWAVRTLARRYINEVGDDPDTSVMIQLELKGLAGIGNRLDEFLERGILGYEVDR